MPHSSPLVAPEQVHIPFSCANKQFSIEWAGAQTSTNAWTIYFTGDAACGNGTPIHGTGATAQSCSGIDSAPSTKYYKYAVVVANGGGSEDPQVVMDGRTLRPTRLHHGGAVKQYTLMLTSKGAKRYDWPHWNKDTLRVGAGKRPIEWRVAKAASSTFSIQFVSSTPCLGDEKQFTQDQPFCIISDDPCAGKESCSFDYQAKIGDKQLTGLKIVVHK
jgi:hypothetical protein